MSAHTAHLPDPVGLDDDVCYRAIVDTAVEAIVVIDEAGVICSFNPAAERLFGYSAHEVIGSDVKILIPPAQHPTHEARLARRLALPGRPFTSDGGDVDGLRRDGSTFALEVSLAEWWLRGERFFTGILRDVTDRRRAQDHQRLLLDELNHRVKNTLAMVQAVAGQTLRNARSLQDARTALTSRLLALAKAHDLLTRESWEGAPMADIVSAAIHAHGGEARFEISGPPVRLPPSTALAISMALNELSTNAAKYGALSNDSGLVRIAWSLDGESGEVLNLRWEEIGGPPVQAPTHRGFGTRMIQGGLSYELGGSARLDFRPSGLFCAISARVPGDPTQKPEP
jgi:PAS domain S-box-containing protein